MQVRVVALAATVCDKYCYRCTVPPYCVPQVLLSVCNVSERQYWPSGMTPVLILVYGATSVPVPRFRSPLAS
eukprot:1140610-Rhodomonas_salina.1